MTHWSRPSTFVNHLAVAQKAAGEAFCKCRHVWASRLKTVWCLFLGELWHQGQHLTPVFPHRLRVLQACGIKHGGFRLKNLRKWIHRYNLSAWVLRPRNKTTVLWRYTVFLRHFLVDASAATVCLGSFTTFYKAGKSFENLPLLFLLNLYLDFIYVTIQGVLEKQVAWIKSLQILLRHLLCLKTWPSPV